ncbi:MAG: LicD family protein [Clostridia bacterium]|nr:LicD family protein [Clostridia bacterium]
MSYDIEYVQNIELNILKVIDQICKENNIEYFLSSGTLLGAIRHDGFIPWDDDIDIMMRRREYERFLNIVPKYLPKYMQLIHYKYNNTEEDQNLLVKIIDNRYPCIRKSYKNIKTSVWVDVFALDGVPDSSMKRRIFFLKLDLLTKIRGIKRWELYSADYKSPSRIKNLMIGVNRKVRITSLIDINKLLKKQDRILSSFDRKKCSLLINYMGEYKKKEVFPDKWLGAGKRHRFADDIFPIPEYSEKYLTKLYGDFMQKPPESERVCKHQLELLKNT